MTLNIKLKRSATLNSAPTAAQLEDGELGINYNAASIALYAKDSAGTIRKIAGQGAEGSYWELASNVLSPESNAYGVEIGSGNISMNAPGFIDIYRPGQNGNGSAFRIYGDILGGGTRANTARLFDSGTLLLGSSDGSGSLTDSNANIQLYASDGSATFNSTGQFGGSWSNDDSPQVRAFIGSNVGSVRVKGSASGGAGSNAFGVYAGGSSASSQTYGVYYDGHVEIGGLIGSAPNISLNADGSAELTNDLILRRSSSVYASLDAHSSVDLDITVNAGRANTEGRVKFRGSRGGGNLATRSLITAAGDIYIGGTLDTTAGSEDPNIELNADGSVVSGPISTQNNTSAVNYLWRKTTTAGDAVLRCKSNVTLTTGSDPFAVKANGDTEISGDVTIGGTLPSAPNITLNADGTSTFEGLLTVNEAVRADRTGPTQQCFSARLNGTANAEISADGSAKFAGVVQVDGSFDNEYALRLKNSSSTKPSGVLIDLPNTSADVNPAIRVKVNGGVDTTLINTDGSATFAGDITAANVTFNLEPDNPANYTTTEEEYEVEVPVLRPDGPVTADLVDGEPEQEMQTITRTREVTTYTGPTMDVKDTLLKITEALTQLKTAAASATTCEELRTAIDTALADV